MSRSVVKTFLMAAACSMACVVSLAASGGSHGSHGGGHSHGGASHGGGSHGGNSHGIKSHSSGRFGGRSGSSPRKSFSGMPRSSGLASNRGSGFSYASRSNASGFSGNT